MNNNHEHNANTHTPPFVHGFHVGTTIQNVFRNINQAFAGSPHPTGSVQRDDMQPPLAPAAFGQDTRPADVVGPQSTSAVPEHSISSVSAPADTDRPPQSQLDSQRDDDEDSIPELRSVSDSSESDAAVASSNPQNPQPVDDDHDSAWTDDVDPPPFQPITGSRRARVDDDVDDARDRRHPSERVGGPSPPGDSAPQDYNPQQPHRPPNWHTNTPAGFLGALFGLGPPGGNPPREGPPAEHTHTGEGTADPSPAGNNTIPDHSPRGVPILTAGFTLTIPLFGPAPGTRTGPAAGTQGEPPGIFGMDAATREELFASFATFFHEFQALDEAREDPERAKKLVGGLEVVPLGLVKRLERVGGAPGGHVGDPTENGEGSSSGCAICWDSLLDAESDSLSGQSSEDQPSSSEDEASQSPSGQREMSSDSDVMDVDPVSPSHPELAEGTSASTPLSSEAPKIIALPCAHVFHASCLLPWFARAKQATCPTCRFNIDPENLTYTPVPGRAFGRAPPNSAAPNLAQVDPHAPEVPSEGPATNTHTANGAPPPINSTPVAADARPATFAEPSGPAPPPPTGQAGSPLAGPGFSPFVALPGIPVLSIPAIQIPLRPAAAQAPGGGNQGTSFSPTVHVPVQSLPSMTDEHPSVPAGIDILTIGLDMFVGGPPHEERSGNPRDNAGGAEGADNGVAGTGAGNANGLAQDLQSLIEGLLRTTRDMIPQVINVPEPAPGPVLAPPEDGHQPSTRPTPETAGPRPAPPVGGPRFFPILPNSFRPTRPMPPRRERKPWTLPPAPGPSLRQRVEQREREQGLRCSDTSCGIGPSDDDPSPDPSVSLTKQGFIHPLPHPDHESDNNASVCAHTFHSACLVSAERVAGWGGEDKTEPLVEVSCPVCRAVGCVTRGEWEAGVSAL